MNGNCHILHKIFYKGNRKNPNCNGGLDVSSTMNRLFGKIRNVIKHEMEEDQSGFTPDRTYTNNLLQQVIE